MFINVLLNSGSDQVTQELLVRINEFGEYRMIPSMVGGQYVIRLCVAFEHANEQHIGEKLTV